MTKIYLAIMLNDDCGERSILYACSSYEIAKRVIESTYEEMCQEHKNADELIENGEFEIEDHILINS